TRSIMRVSPDGGTPQVLASLGTTEQVIGPQLLPGGRALLFTSSSDGSADRWDKASVVVQSLATGKRDIVIRGGADARYIRSGHIVYAVGGILFAVPFDLNRLAVTGGARAVIEGVRRNVAGSTGVAHFDVSNSGTLVYVEGPRETTSGRLDLLSTD